MACRSAACSRVRITCLLVTSEIHSMGLALGLGTRSSRAVVTCEATDIVPATRSRRVFNHAKFSKQDSTESAELYAVPLTWLSEGFVRSDRSNLVAKESIQLVQAALTEYSRLHLLVLAMLARALHPNY